MPRHVDSARRTKPWERQGIGRATYYRRQAKERARQQAAMTALSADTTEAGQMPLVAAAGDPTAEPTAAPVIKETMPWDADGLDRAERVRVFIEQCPVAAGTLFGAKMTVYDWQWAILQRLYATDADGTRPVRQALITMPRKNGKTGLVAALVLAHLSGPEARPRGEVVSAAADREQAALIWRSAYQIAQSWPWLWDRLDMRVSVRGMTDRENGSNFQAISADAGTKHGLSCDLIIYDELAQAPNRRLWDVLTTSQAARAEPLCVVISTQSADPHSVMQEQVAYARQVQSGAVDDPTYLPVIYEAPTDADPWDPAVWAACNPGLGTIRSRSELEHAARMAQAIPAREPAFRSLYLNQPVDADRADGYVDMAVWMEGFNPDGEPPPGGATCYGGLDLSQVRDLTAMVLYFPDTGHLHVEAWVPADSLDRREDVDRVPYRTWAADGHVHTTPGATVSRRHVVYRMLELQQQYSIQQVAYDRWGIEQVQDELDEQGGVIDLVEHGQGFKDMAGSLNSLETLIYDRALRHRSPVLNWCISNAVCDVDPSGNRKLSKRRARERIDAAVAAVMAVGIADRERGAVMTLDGAVVTVGAGG